MSTMTSHTPVKVGILCSRYDILTILLFILDFIYIWNRAMHVKLNIKIYIYIYIGNLAPYY